MESCCRTSLGISHGFSQACLSLSLSLVARGKGKKRTGMRFQELVTSHPPPSYSFFPFYWRWINDSCLSPPQPPDRKKEKERKPRLDQPLVIFVSSFLTFRLIQSSKETVCRMSLSSSFILRQTLRFL